MSLTRRHLFGILTGAAAYAVAPEPVRRYFIIGQPERHVRWTHASYKAALVAWKEKYEMREAILRGAAER